MPHQCVHCGKIYPNASKELLEGCSCGSKFFFYIQDSKVKELSSRIKELDSVDKDEIEKEVREMVGEENEETPVILDLESIRVIAPGRYEIDVVNLFNKKRPLIFKLEEGKYIIDIASTLKSGLKEIKRDFKAQTK